jgi:hypothetical protein
MGLLRSVSLDDHQLRCVPGEDVETDPLCGSSQLRQGFQSASLHAAPGCTVSVPSGDWPGSAMIHLLRSLNSCMDRRFRHCKNIITARRSYTNLDRNLLL